MDTDHVPVRKHISNHVKRLTVVGIIEGGNQHQPIRDVEIGIACRQPLPLKHNRSRHRQLDDVVGMPIWSACVVQPLQIFLQRQMVLVLRIRLRNSDDRQRTNKTRDVVDVAMGIVSRDAAVHPQHLVDAEIIMKNPLQIFAAEAWITLLHLAQQAFLGSDKCAVAVDIDTAAFQHHTVTGNSGVQLGS